MHSDLLSYSTRLILLKRSLGRDSTADLYRATCNRLRCYVGGCILPFSGVTPGFIDGFIVFLRQSGLAVNSINSYLSCFRAIYNSAVREDLYTPVKHPFRFLRLKRAVTAKRAVSVSFFQEACRLDIREAELVRSLDYHIFSFLACGMAFIDMAHLTHDNIVGDEIVYNRRKTGTQIRVSLTRGIRSILCKYSSADSRYLFPILSRGEGHEAYKSALARHNASLHRIGNRLRRPVRLTSYVARHSWATEAFRQHVPVSVISQALGHTSEKTTRIYLDQLDQSVLDKANVRITKPVVDLLGKENGFPLFTK